MVRHGAAFFSNNAVEDILFLLNLVYMIARIWLCVPEGEVTLQISQSYDIFLIGPAVFVISFAFKYVKRNVCILQIVATFAPISVTNSISHQIWRNLILHVWTYDGSSVNISQTCFFFLHSNGRQYDCMHLTPTSCVWKEIEESGKGSFKPDMLYYLSVFVKNTITGDEKQSAIFHMDTKYIGKTVPYFKYM